ncbi:hypothetical protein AB4257_23200, partial [Vibrio splendidus]
AKHQRLEGSSFNKKPNIRPHLNFYYQNHFVNTWIPYTKWGIFELENATGKNSTCEGFGHKRASDFTKLENHP